MRCTAQGRGVGDPGPLRIIQSVQKPGRGSIGQCSHTALARFASCLSSIPWKSWGRAELNPLVFRGQLPCAHPQLGLAECHEGPALCSVLRRGQETQGQPSRGSTNRSSSEGGMGLGQILEDGRRQLDRGEGLFQGSPPCQKPVKAKAWGCHSFVPQVGH